MKKKLFSLIVAQLVFVGLMLFFYFLPLEKEAYMWNFSLAYLMAGAKIFASPLYYGVALHPIFALLFTVLIILKAIKIIKYTKSEDAEKPNRLHTKFLWILVVLAILYFITLFILFGQGDGDWAGIFKSLVYCLVPAIGLGVTNKKLKKLNKKISKIEKLEDKIEEIKETEANA